MLLRRSLSTRSTTRSTFANVVRREECGPAGSCDAAEGASWMWMLPMTLASSLGQKRGLVNDASPSTLGSCGVKKRGKQGRRGQRTGGVVAYLGDGLLDALFAVGEVEREDFARVDHERDDARGDEDGDEERRDGVEARPAVVLDQQRRHNHADGAEGVLQRDQPPCSRKEARIGYVPP